MIDHCHSISCLMISDGIGDFIVALLVIVDEVVVGCEYDLALCCPGKFCVDIYQKNPNIHGLSGQCIVVISENCILCIVT